VLGPLLLEQFMRATLMISTFVLAIAVLVGGPARADCGTLPNVQWWNDLTLAAMRQVVDRRYDGDWGSYIAKWERQKDLLVDWRSSGTAAAMPFTGEKPDGKPLTNYIDQVDGRLNLAYCLAAADGFEGLSGLAVAAGADEE